jgi:hypothetical protein
VGRVEDANPVGGARGPLERTRRAFAKARVSEAATGEVQGARCPAIGRAPGIGPRRQDPRATGACHGSTPSPWKIGSWLGVAAASSAGAGGGWADDAGPDLPTGRSAGRARGDRRADVAAKRTAWPPTRPVTTAPEVAASTV